MNLLRLNLLLFCLIVFVTGNSNPGYAVVETVEFADSNTEKRYKNLIAELRCLVCQNQNIAESDADLAKDLRRKTAEMLNTGKTDRQVRSYMRERYGDFVLYKPPFEGLITILWLSPVLLLLALIVGLVITVKRRQKNERLNDSHFSNTKKHSKVRKLLRDAPKLDDH